MIKKLYKERIKTLAKEYDKFKKFAIKKNSEFSEYINIINDIEKEVEKISNDTNIEPNKKYIQINEKLDYINKISFEMSKIKSDIDKRKSKIVKERDLLIESCLNDQKNLTKEDIFREISKYTKIE